MSTFTLPFPEYDIANELQKEFPKRKNFSVAIPLSRQQKFYDLLLVNGANKKVVTIQVKSSRTWLGTNKKDKFQYYSWLNYFDIKDNYSDFYFIYMTYPFDDKNFGPRKWNRKIIVFNRKEMVQILNSVKTKKGTQERFFSFGFSANNKVGGARGFSNFKKNDFSKNLLRFKLKEIRRQLR